MVGILSIIYNIFDMGARGYFTGKSISHSFTVNG